ncbi:hypothetical protein, partial [Nonomuraea sp. NPDC050691]|uniref:hypothetical protein n=1 Tax=Nonomuraea sp. NPDC050691 TaxID=3155661 RepID=UPI0033C1CF26
MTATDRDAAGSRPAPLTDAPAAPSLEILIQRLDPGLPVRPEQYTVIPPGVRLGPVPDRLEARGELG